MRIEQQLADALRPILSTLGWYATESEWGNGPLKPDDGDAEAIATAQEALAAYDALPLRKVSPLASEHTRGPWQYEGTQIFIDGRTVAQCAPYPEALHDARRIVACVNACEGLTTEELERLDDGMLNTLVRDTL